MDKTQDGEEFFEGKQTKRLPPEGAGISVRK